VSTSKVGLANLALLKIGAKRISSFSEDSPEGRIVNAVYDDIRDEVLVAHNWTFAQERAVLATLDEDPIYTEDGMTVVYARPSGMLKLVAQSDSTAIIKLEKDKILSDTTALKIGYTVRIDDPLKYFPSFTTALATRLAAEIAFNLTEARSEARGLLEEYETVRLPYAIAADSQQGTPQFPLQDEWENARLAGIPWARANAGEETWHPGS